MGVHKWHVGLVLLVVVIVSWVSSGFLVNAASDEYAKPYFITYVNTSLFTVYLGPTALRALGRSGGERAKYTPVDGRGGFTTRQTAGLGAQFAALWFLSNCFNNASYMYTSVGSSTIMACTSGLFTLALGVVFRTEVFSLSRLGAVLLSFLGVALVSRADENDGSAPPHALLGNLLSLTSAFLYAAYSTLLKSRVHDETRLDSKQFFGFVGLFNLLFLWPVVLLAHWLNIEPFGWPSDTRVWALLSLNALITLLSDFLWVLATLFTSPLVVTVGLSGTIPLSMLGDFFLRGRLGSPIYYVGAAMVLWSFFVVNKHSKKDHTDHSDDNNQPLHA